MRQGSNMRLRALLAVITLDYCLMGTLSKDAEVRYHPRAAPRQRRSADTTPDTAPSWAERGQQELLAALNVRLRVKPATNVILFIGDGMGVSTLTAARFLKSQTTGTAVPDTALSWEGFPATGLIKTYNTDQQVPDSAGTATAFLTGEKTRAGTVGVNQHVPRGECPRVAGNQLESFLHRGIGQGKWAGVVTTTRITHATPASAYAHSADRDWEDDSVVKAADQDPEECWDIARQLVHGDGNDQLRVILGGGRRHMIPNTQTDPEYPGLTGQRQDGRDLRQDWLDVHRNMGLAASRYRYVENKTDFDSVDASATDYLMGLFEPSNMKYDADRQAEEPTGNWTEPSLAEMTRKAVDVLSRGPDGYTLLVEGGRIDHGHHDNLAQHALRDTLALDEAVAAAVGMTDEDDTLIVVTADHSHVFTMGGYQSLNNDVLGLVVRPDDEVELLDDDKPYMTLGYTNGPGYYPHRTSSGDISQSRARLNLTGVNIKDKSFVVDAALPRDSETHGGEDVAVYARGPMSHLFSGQHEQHYIAHAAMYASCLGPNNGLCSQGGQVGPASSVGATPWRHISLVAHLSVAVCLCHSFF